MSDERKEHEIPEWDRVRLCKCVGQWLGHVRRSNTNFDITDRILIPDEGDKGESVTVPDYCNSARHAWWLLERMPRMVVQMGDGSTFSGEWLEVYDDPKRALAEAAATLAARGVEPREG